MIEVIPLKYGRVFKRAFGQPEVFNSFVSDVLGIPVHVDTVHTEYEHQQPVGFVKSRYDLFAEDTKQRLVIEIQQAKEEDFFERFFYYHMISLIEQVPDYSAYWFNKTVYTIVVLISVPKDGSVKFSYATQDLSLIDEYNHRLAVYPHRLIFLTPRLVNTHTPPAARKWLDLIKDSLDSKMDETAYTCAPFPLVLKSIQRSTMTPEEFAEIKTETVWEDAKKRIKAEGKAEGLAEGKAEGLAEGEAKGKAEGLAEGEAKGKAEGLAEGQATILKRQLTKRFGSLPAWAIQRVEAADMVQLEIWAEAIFTATSLEHLLS